jgi:SNF2 family DNA or RNA helicase
MEMGTGKSKVLLDNIGDLYHQDKLNFALIIAPKGVYRTWVENEIPKHLSDSIPRRIIRWSSTPNKKQTLEINSVKEHFNGLTLFVMNVESFSSLKGKLAGEWLAKKYGNKGLIAIDESTTIKNHKAKRTKTLTTIARGFWFKRILTGSPITNSPMDLYPQITFLGSRLIPFDSFYTFQARFSILQKRNAGTHQFTQILGYKNLDELTEMIDPFTFRVLKKDCLDLPSKNYIVRYVSLTSEQVDWYNKIKKDAIVLLENDMVSVQSVITQMLRLQQIISGHVKSDDDKMYTFPSNKLKELLSILEEHDGKVIIWSRFRHDIKEITTALQQVYGAGSAAAYFGDTPEEERVHIMQEFENPGSKLKYFVGNPSTGGYGLTLNQANLTIYYSNDFNLANRIQSEDRNHRMNQDKKVTYIDLVAEDTIDEKIVESLQKKITIGAKVLNEEARQWLNLTPKKTTR